jgi:hypothetical protein
MSTQLPDRPAGVWRRGDPVALAAALALIAIAAVVGRELNERGVPLVLPRPPLIAHWRPHVGWGSPLAIVCVVAGLRLQRVAATVPRHRLLVAGWLLNLAWMSSLTLVDGIHRGWVNVLLNANEYLHDLPRITSPTTFLATFTHFIAFSPSVDGTQVWTTHVAGHPPLATLVFWLLAEIGLGGGFWAGALCILAGSTVTVALPVILGELGAATAARRLVPFIALFPGAVWMAVSADGLFAGVAVSGLALVTRGAVRGRLLSGAIGGLLLGVAVFLSYGLVLFAVPVIVVAVLTMRRHGWRRSAAPWILATVGFLVVAALHLAYGFNWLTGLAQLRIRYYQGIASGRPFSYFVYADLAAWLVSCSPMLAIGVGRALRVLVQQRVRPWTQDHMVALVALSGVAVALIADVSGMSKAETERIWLPFGALAYSGLALLRGRMASWSLLAASVWALLVNHLFLTGW